MKKASDDNLDKVLMALEETKAKAASELATVQENLRAENLRAQQAFEAENNKLKEKIATLTASKGKLIRDRKSLLLTVKVTKDRVVELQAEIPKLVEEGSKELVRQYAKACRFPSPMWSEDDFVASGSAGTNIGDAEASSRVVASEPSEDA